MSFRWVCVNLPGARGYLGSRSHVASPAGGQFIQVVKVSAESIGRGRQIEAWRRTRSNTHVVATSLALKGDGHHHVSFDAAVATLRQASVDMSAKYKETSQSGAYPSRSPIVEGAAGFSTHGKGGLGAQQEMQPSRKREPPESPFPAGLS